MTEATTDNDKNVSTKSVTAMFENELGSEEVSGERVCKSFGYFDAKKSDFYMEKINLTENTWLYVNQAFLTVKKNKKIFYCDYFVLGQIVEASKTPQNSSSYSLKDNKVKMVLPCYDSETGEFGGLYETVGFLVVRGSPEKVFLNYGYDKEKSKVLYSHYRRKIPNSFSGTIFDCHRTMIEIGEIEGEMSNNFSSSPL